MDDAIKAVLAIGFFLAFFFFLIFIGPFCSIWSINTLFGTEIVLTFKTWVAMAWLHLVIGSSFIKNKKNNNNE